MYRERLIDSLVNRMLLLCISLVVFTSIITYIFAVHHEKCSGYAIIAVGLSLKLTLLNLNELSECIDDIKDNLPERRKT